MRQSYQLIVCLLDRVRFALELSAVEKVVRAVEVTPLPDAPPGVLGVINLHGRILPVFDMRSQFDLPMREVQPDDHFVIAQSGPRTVAVLADTVGEVVEFTGAPVSNADDILPGLESLKGIVSLDGDIIFIENLEQFLASGHQTALDAALENQG